MSSDRETALLIIDVQVGLLSDEQFPIHDGEGLIARLKEVIERARAAGVPVIYVQHCGGSDADPLHPSKPGFAISPDIAPQPGEVIVQKRHPDSFQETTLQQELERRGIKRLVIGGMETPMCIDATTRRAYSLGYGVTLIADGHSTPAYGGLTAPQMIDHYNTVLGMAFAAVKPASEVAFGD